MIAASSSSGAGAQRVAGPLAAELEREGLRRLVAGAREGEDAAPLVQRDLADDVRAGAEAVEPEARRIARHAQRAVSDEPGAQQRRRLEVAEALRQRERVAAVGHGARRVAAVAVEAREPRALAEVLAPAGAEAARPVGPAQPRDADAGARRVLGVRARLQHGGDDLVAGDHRQPRAAHLAVADVQVGAAHAAGMDLHEHVARAIGAELGVRQLARLQRAAGLVEDHRAHRFMIYPRRHGCAHGQLRSRQAQALQWRGSSPRARGRSRALRVRRHRVRRGPRPDRRDARRLAHDPRRILAAAALLGGARRALHALPGGRHAVGRRGRARDRPGRRRRGAQQPVRAGRRPRRRPVGPRRLRAHAPQPGRLPRRLCRPVPGVRREPQRGARPRARERARTRAGPSCASFASSSAGARPTRPVP